MTFDKSFPYIIYCDSMEEVQEAVETPEFIRPMLLIGAAELLRTEADDFLIADILSLDTYATVRISIGRSEIMNVLRATLTWFESRQEYEECAECQRLIDLWTVKLNSIHEKSVEV